MHPPHVRAEALALVEAGLNDCEISRRLGVPRRTILDWRRPTYVPREPAIPREICPRCWRSAKPIRFTDEDYAELLGLYLGDGSISEGPRAQRLRLYLDARYSVMNEEIRKLLRRCFPHNRVADTKPSPSAWSGRSDSWLVLSVYSTHLECLFPQHGTGRKHERRIRLEPWQTEIVEIAPWQLIRGLIRADGCSFINRTDIHRPRPYEYLSYEFSNMSKDIVDVFEAACDRVGVFTRTTGGGGRRWSVRINRRDSVALMLEHVGLKK
ncbi:MAG: helix-turn-helix domain-containing protein [Solirubrobacterales bacterium]